MDYQHAPTNIHTHTHAKKKGTHTNTHMHLHTHTQSEEFAPGSMAKLIHTKERERQYYTKRKTHI